MGEEEKLLQVEIVPPKKNTNKDMDKRDVMRILVKLLRFFDNDIDTVIEYIDLEQVPVHFITSGKRIDLHPTREYLLRLVRVVGDIERQMDKLDDEDEDLDNIWG
jgi:hypothetical protein